MWYVNLSGVSKMIYGNYMDNNLGFIIVDDDYGNNLYCKIIIKKMFPDAEIKSFLIPEKCIEYLKTEYLSESGKKTILLLDLNMPTMSAWEFLDIFSELTREMNNEISIFILSSVLNKKDKESAGNYKNVAGYILKPLTKEKVQSITAN